MNKIVRALAAGGVLVWSVAGQAPASLQERVAAIMSRPEFVHARFGMEFRALDDNTPVFRMNEQQFFVSGSTTKLLTEGTALALLGPDYRFHTRVFRSGEIDSGGTLHGDLVLVASPLGDQAGPIRRIQSVVVKYVSPVAHAVHGLVR